MSVGVDTFFSVPPARGRLQKTAQATSDGAGNVTLTFEQVAGNQAWTGGVTVQGAEPDIQWSVFVNNQLWGTFFGFGPLAPVQGLANDTVTVVSTDARPDAAYTAFWTGKIEDLAHAEYVYPGGGTGSPSAQARSIADQHVYELTMDFTRRLEVVSGVAPPAWTYPAGRVIAWEDFEGLAVGAIPAGGARGWRNIAGTTAISNANSHGGVQCLALTAAAGAGNQAAVRKRFHLLADQGAAPPAEVIMGCWFNPNNDPNWRELHLRVLLDDTVRLFEGWAQFFRRSGGVASNTVAFLNSANTTTGLTPTYAISDNDVWHFLVVALNYRQAGYLTYQQLRMDDQNYDPGQPNGYGGGATGGVREVTVDIVITNDNAGAASTVLVDDFVLCDLSNNLNQA